MTYFLRIKLLSGTCFSSGQGFVAEVDTDIEQESVGLPVIRGRTIKGLLVEECALILKVLSEESWHHSAERLFGQPGQATSAILRINDAYLPTGLRTATKRAVNRPDNPLSKQDIMHSVTDIRYQTKINLETGAPQEHSLRATRLALRDLVFYSRLFLPDNVSDAEKAVLAACALSVRRGGLNRNRGWGRLQMRIVEDDRDVTTDWARNLPHEEGGQV